MRQRAKGGRGGRREGSAEEEGEKGKGEMNEEEEEKIKERGREKTGPTHL